MLPRAAQDLPGLARSARRLAASEANMWLLPRSVPEDKVGWLGGRRECEEEGVVVDPETGGLGMPVVGHQ